MTAPARLKSGMWVAALLRHCGSLGLPAVRVRRGDDDAGSVLIKLNLMGAGFRVLVPVNDASGDRVWMAAIGSEPVDEAQADAYIARAIDRDYDLWVVEIEDAQGRSPFGEPVIE